MDHFLRSPRAAGLLVLALLAAPSQAQPLSDSAPLATSVTLPLVSGWFQGQSVQYITTDVSDPNAARDMGVNYVPRLAAAIPAQPRQPGQPGAVERIYSFGNFKQGGVLPSVPLPTGPANADRNYSPLWRVSKVNWIAGHEPRVLKSEEEVLAAAEQGEVSITQTTIIVNCPVIFSIPGGLLPHAKID